ncbi:MAG: hypothetical protein KBD05_01710 [Candidatus Pacebacteria bacterium]|nr:hypothetical protein [Candidatus Paceibacterota bacterium]
MIESEPKTYPWGIADAEIVRQMVKNAVAKGDARSLEEVVDDFVDREGVLEAELGIEKGQITNHPELVDLRALRAEVEEGRRKAWELQGIQGSEQ